jgi:hypothetical protein
MQHKHPLDRLGVALRKPLAILAIPAFPIFLFSYGKMLADAYYAWPGWLWAIALVSQIVGWLGISALFDSLKERHQMTQDEQS